MAARDVTPPRRYDSPRRRAQAEATRAEILRAAQRLFERDGFAATTMASVAAEAGVALKTVYVAFATKSGLLRALWNVLLRGDAEDVPMGERPWYRDMLAEPDPGARLDRMARQSRAVKDRAGRLLVAIRDAAAGDDDAAALWNAIEAQFRGLLEPVARTFAEEGSLRAGLDPERAADVLWALNHPDVWRLLVRVRGWSADEYEVWLAGAFRRELLAG
ncbi:MAG TPA: helix-turn-helix domain-containing protein [Miltoncostaeaceae bacterium]|nr:helix-turn-helix domain-containing protein [Miltoncostaeaceae bacterium]